MSETNELFASVNYIKLKVDSLERIELLRMRTDDNLKTRYKDFLQNDTDMLKVYKSIDGVKSQKEIATSCQLNDMQVSRKITKLESEGLIELVSAYGRKNKIYAHTVVERAYNFCNEL